MSIKPNEIIYVCMDTDVIPKNKHKTNVMVFYMGDKWYSTYEYTLKAGSVPDSIEQHIKKDIEETYKEITEYEIFDVETEGDCQGAKIRVLKIKED